MPHLALKFYDARNMVCPSMKSHWADLGNCFMPINLLPPFSGKWSEIWFHIISHKYVSLESLLHCFTKTMWPKSICVWDKCWKTNAFIKLTLESEVFVWVLCLVTYYQEAGEQEKVGRFKDLVHFCDAFQSCPTRKSLWSTQKMTCLDYSYIVKPPVVF